MAAIVFPISSAPGSVPQEGSGRLINAYAVKTEQGARTPFQWKRSAGLREILNITGHSHCRGFIKVASTLIVVLDERVYAVTLSGVTFSAVNLGALAGSDKVTIARNNAATPNIVAVCEAGVFNLFPASAPTAFADGDLPASNSVTGLNGYLIFSTGAGEIWSTGLNAVTVATDANTNAQIKPDGLRRVVGFRGELFAFGDDSIQVFEETGDSPFPLRYKKITMPYGICGTHAVGGYEDGWGGDLFWVGEDNQVGRLEGYSRVVISNDDVSRAIATAAGRTLIEVSVYMDGRNEFVAITSPDEWTWEYNKTTGAWNERQSYDRDDWRARCAIKAFDRWIVGDATTGKLFAVDNTYKREANDALIWHVESGDNANFPYPVTIPAMFFDFVAAVGSAAGEDPIETAPVVMVSWSLDGGYSWGNELRRSLGAQGAAGALVRVNACVTTKSKGIRIRLRVSDPVFVGFAGGQLPDIAARAACAAGVVLAALWLTWRLWG
jgi:hypothetical protein